MQTDSADRWRAQDFIDEPTPNFDEEDPWDPVRILDRSSPPQKFTPKNSAAIAGRTPSVPDDREDNEQPHSVSAQDTFPSYQVEETFPDEPDMPDGWFEDAPSVGSEFEGDSGVDLEEEPLEEPIPTDEFDPDLSNELYQEPESIDLTDIDIRFDKFLASVGLSEYQDEQIRDHLKEFSKARLSNWLPWLASKIWTARTLLLFVQFHNNWEDNPEWWESRRYHWRRGWQPMELPISNILSRDNAYIIVHQRMRLPPDEMIDPLWFEEWDYHSLWKHGFWSFASFVKFRAALNDGEEWASLVKWQSADHDMEMDSWLPYIADQMPRSANDSIPVQEDCLPPYSHATTLPRWYDIQDWYPKHEWHDNLDWNIPSLEIDNPLALQESSQGPIWPIGGRNE